MIPVTTAWVSSLVVILTVWVVLLRRSGAEVALGIAVVLSYLLPIWVEIDVVGLPFDVRLTVAIVALLGFAMHPRSRIWSPLTLPDIVISCLVIIHVLSDVVNDGFSIGIPLRAYGEWAVPYLAGRYAVRNHDELRKIAPWAIGVLALMSVEAIVESLTGINLWELLFARNAGDFVPYLGRRFGFMRSTGPAINAIFFAMMLLLLLPWPAVTFNRPGARGGRWMAGISAILAVCGLLATISRGPIGGLVAAAGFVSMIRIPRLRWVGAGLLIMAVACAVIWPKEILQLTRTGINDEDRHQKTVQLDGEEVEYSGTLTRLLLFRAYARPLRHARFLGYGTQAVRVFPPNIPHLPAKSETIHLMRHVDNAYVLMGLRFGWLGIFTFALLPLATVWTAIVLSRTIEFAGICSWLAGVIGASALVLLTVYFANDFGSIFLWTCGIVAGLATHAVTIGRQGEPRD